LFPAADFHNLTHRRRVWMGDSDVQRKINFAMSKKYWILLMLAVALGTAYVIYFTTWFRPGTLQIYHTSRNVRSRFQPAPSAPVMLFVINRQVALTKIKVVSLAAYQTNQNILPLWHLVSDSNSVPMDRFVYGQPIRGMKPMVAGSRAEPLASNVVYHLIVEAGKFHGEHDFELK
jgi:hypothetical protein